MPNIITHILFAKDLKESIEDSYKDRILNNQQLFEIGSNGPDFCFFYGLNPTKPADKLEISKLGSDMHSHHINDFYMSCLEMIRNAKNEEVKEDMIVYTWGHLCHWALDSTTHPYVYYRTGDCKGESSWWHHRFESCLDAILLKYKTGLTTKDFQAKDICDVPLEKTRAICRIYVPFAHKYYGMTNLKGHHIVQCLNDWHFIQTLLYDVNGTKYNIIHRIEKMIGKEHILGGLLVPNDAIDDYDILNLQHKTWTHPCDDTLVSTESFLDLYDKAIVKAQNVIRLFTIALENPEKENDLFNFIGDKNYTMAMNEDKPMEYFNRIQDHV